MSLMPVIREMASAAIDEFLASRQREGAKLASIINERVEGMRALAQRAAPQMPALVEAYQVNSPNACAKPARSTKTASVRKWRCSLSVSINDEEPTACAPILTKSIASSRRAASRASAWIS